MKKKPIAPKSRVFACLLTGLNLVGLLFLSACHAPQTQEPVKIPGFLKSSLQTQLESEKLILSVPSSQQFGAHLLYLTEEPHQTGSPRNYELADYVRDRFLEYGLENVHFHDTPALIGYGRSVLVEITEPAKKRLKMAEDPYPPDKDSDLYADYPLVPYHEYAPSADIAAEAVYANGGSPEDFAELDRLGIDVKGKIVIMRYSNPYSYRGYKVYLAESRGAAGSIIYSDPQDDGFFRGESYPRGPWGPPSHIQWGGIVYDWFGFGITPFTFHWRQKEDGTWEEGSVRDKALPRIPSVPMSHEDASQILSLLEGPAVPEAWQGGLPFTYHVGPGPVKVHMKVDNVEKVALMRNVVGSVPGSQEPDKWVIAGNHRDAWIYGGYDPSSGTAALLEVARALGTALKQGFRPRRTIVLANWDAEEDLLGGSTAWTKDNRAKLLRDGVVYVNLDSAACGPEFNGGSTPSLADFLIETAKAVPHPDIPGGSVYDHWIKASKSGKAEVEAIVGATDYTAFQENVGMSCIDMTFGESYGVYHSMYDNYFWMSQIGDPGFRYNVTCSQMLALILWRLANADILPADYSNYARSALAAIEEIESLAGPQKNLRLDRARVAAQRWLKEASAWEKKVREYLVSGVSLDPKRAAEVNSLLMDVERAMTEEEGLKSRPYFKHLIYAPQPTYREELLPRIFEAIKAQEWDDIPRYEVQLVRAFQRAAQLMGEASRRL
jgi:N-acetylated-alpha-linked acidic dipeptidase